MGNYSETILSLVAGATCSKPHLEHFVDEYGFIDKYVVKYPEKIVLRCFRLLF